MWANAVSIDGECRARVGYILHALQISTNSLLAALGALCFPYGCVAQGCYVKGYYVQGSGQDDRLRMSDEDGPGWLAYKEEVGMTIDCKELDRKLIGI